MFDADDDVGGQRGVRGEGAAPPAVHQLDPLPAGHQVVAEGLGGRKGLVWEENSDIL